MIAATLAKGVVEKPVTAIANAASLYDAACEHLETKARFAAVRQLKADEKSKLPRPDKFPAIFNNILNLIVRAKTPADGTKRFRDYLRDDLTRYYAESVPIEPLPSWAQNDRNAWDARAKEHKPTRPRPSWVQLDSWKHLDKLKLAGKTEQLVAAIEEQVVHGIEHHKLGLLEPTWFWLANDYLNWWAGKLTEQRRAAGKRSKKKS